MTLCSTACNVINLDFKMYFGMDGPAAHMTVQSAQVSAVHRPVTPTLRCFFLQPGVKLWHHDFPSEGWT